MISAEFCWVPDCSSADQRLERCRPASDFDLLFAAFFADLRMARESLKPVFAVEAAPDIVGCGEKLGGIAEGPPRHHLSRPTRRSAAGKQFGLCLGRGKTVQPVEGIFHRQRMIVAEGAGTQGDKSDSTYGSDRKVGRNYRPLPGHRGN